MLPKTHLASASAHFCQVAEVGEGGDTHIFFTEAEFFGSSPALGHILFAQPTCCLWQERCALGSAYIEEVGEQVA